MWLYFFVIYEGLNFYLNHGNYVFVSYLAPLVHCKFENYTGCHLSRTDQFFGVILIEPIHFLLPHKGVYLIIGFFLELHLVVLLN
jgi:hypothetical protein